MWTWSQCSGSILVWRWSACLCPIHFSRDTINSPGTNAPPYGHTTSKMLSVWHHNPSLMMSLSLFVYICDRSIQLCFYILCQWNSERIHWAKNENCHFWTDPHVIPNLKVHTNINQILSLFLLAEKIIRI